MGWNLRGTYLEFCNCDPGCGCNFKGSPTSPEGNCEAFVANRIEEGRYGDLELAGASIAWALWWPGAIHDKGGRGHASVDCESDEQFEIPFVLESRVLTRVGHGGGERPNVPPEAGLILRIDRQRLPQYPGEDRCEYSDRAAGTLRAPRRLRGFGKCGPPQPVRRGCRSYFFG